MPTSWFPRILEASLMSVDVPTVLLVDDFAPIRQILRGTFESSGFRVCAEAENGAEAIRHATTHKPTLIVLDQSMPVMTGLQSAPVLRRLLPRAVIILFSVLSDKIVNSEVMAAGINSAVTKPDVQELIRMARFHVDLPALGI
jgi:CheY-like chemotaxis protein